jgi:hypothetical protein
VSESGLVEQRVLEQTQIKDKQTRQPMETTVMLDDGKVRLQIVLQPTGCFGLRESDRLDSFLG